MGSHQSGTKLRQQIIQSRIEQTAASLGVPQDIAFLRFAHSIVVGQSMHAFDAADMVDGGQDKQIDIITFEQDADEAVVHILQVKNTTSFESNELIKMHNGLDWVFNRPRSDLETLGNVKFRDRIIEYRAIQSQLGPANIRIKVSFVTNGFTSNASSEWKQETKAITDEYDNGTFAEFSFDCWGADELVDRINQLEKHDRKVDAEISIIYDTNNPSLIKYHAQGLKGLVCTATAKEIARVVNGDSTGSIFDSNIRQFLGTRGAVNTDIQKTCSEQDMSRLFWFLNNGITIVCDSLDPVTDPDNPHVKIKNMQIVNGCQTATTLALAERAGLLAPDVRVLLRIYETKSSDLVDRIVLTTNNQNKINSRDLRANDQVQVDMERGFAKYGLLYERKVRQYDNDPGVNVQRIVPNELVAQSYLAIVLKKPSDARRRKYKVWGELYDQIFGGQRIEPHVIAVLIYRHTVEWLGKSGYANDSDDLTRKVANNGAFHVSRMTAFLWRHGDSWAGQGTDLESQIAVLDGNAQDIDPHVARAFDLLVTILGANSRYVSDLDTAFKSSVLDIDIDKALYSRQ